MKETMPNRTAPLNQADKSGAAGVNSPASFEQAMQELEGLVQRMESGSLSLDESLTSYKRGASLLQFCQQALARAEQEIKVLENDALKPWQTPANQATGSDE